MSFLGPPPLGRHPERRLSVSDMRTTGTSTVRLGVSATSSPVDLAATFADISRRHFGGALSNYQLVYRDHIPDNYDSRCGAEGRFLAGERVIEVKRDMTAEQTRAVVLHEAVHAYVVDELGVSPTDEASAHGDWFCRVAAAIDPTGAPGNVRDAEGWQPKNPTGSLPRVDRAGGGVVERSRTTTGTGRVRSRIDGSVNDYDRPAGDQTLKLRKGKVVPADHWAVAISPDAFEPVR